MRVKGSTIPITYKVFVGGRGVSAWNNGSPVYSEFETQTAGGTVEDSSIAVRDEVQKTARVSGFRPPLPYTMSETTSQWIKGTAKTMLTLGEGDAPNQASWVRWEGAVAPLTASVAIKPMSANERNRLTTTALGKLKSQKVNLAMTLASRQKTIDLLASTSRNLYRAFQAAKARNWAKAAGHLGVQNRVRPGTRSLGAGWLQLQFGWMQLASDIYGLYTEATKGDIPDMLTVRSSIREHSATQDWQEWSMMTTPYNPGKVGALIQTTSARELRLSWTFALDSASVHAAARLGLTNPAHVAWDLVKASYILDWLVPVGKYLSALDADLGFTYLGGSITEFQRVEAKVISSRVTIVPVGPFRKATGTASFKGSATNVRMVRTVQPEPTAGLYIKNPFSSFTVATTAALLASSRR